ncbi:hypothetical protein GCK32_014999 [Trichostrongylus colubriformis]|uniref:Uncharacterized protein n=1 Tax=Trichostrongylus colubriformis TaxID=6319 RepID=A0AAN8G996_TRICO
MKKIDVKSKKTPISSWPASNKRRLSFIKSIQLFPFCSFDRGTSEFGSTSAMH